MQRGPNIWEEATASLCVGARKNYRNEYIKYESYMTEGMNSNQLIKLLSNIQRGWSSNQFIINFIHREKRYVQSPQPSENPPEVQRAEIPSLWRITGFPVGQMGGGFPKGHMKSRQELHLVPRLGSGHPCCSVRHQMATRQAEMSWQRLCDQIYADGQRNLSVKCILLLLSPCGKGPQYGAKSGSVKGI